MSNLRSLDVSEARLGMARRHSHRSSVVFPGQTPGETLTIRPELNYAIHFSIAQRSHLDPPAGKERVHWLRSAFDESSLKVETLTGPLSAARAWEEEAKLAAAAILEPGVGDRTRGGPWCGAKPLSRAWRRQISMVHECTSAARLRALAESCPAVRWHFSRQPAAGEALSWPVAAVRPPTRSGGSGKSNWVGHPKRRAYPRKRPAASGASKLQLRKRPAAALATA